MIWSGFGKMARKYCEKSYDYYWIKNQKAATEKNVAAFCLNRKLQWMVT